MAKGLLWLYTKKVAKGHVVFAGGIPKEYRGNLSAKQALENFGRIIFQFRRKVNNQEYRDVDTKKRLDEVAKVLTKNKRVKKTIMVKKEELLAAM